MANSRRIRGYLCIWCISVVTNQFLMSCLLCRAPGVDGEPYSPPSLWVDIARDIEQAQRLIYITGWSVKADIPLERGEAGGETIGELLKRKAEEVRRG